jgi:membrane fusion protein, adhesin transport system
MSATSPTPTAFAPQPGFAALQRVRTSWPMRWITRGLLLLFIVLPFVLVFVPWQQTVSGRGQIIAYSPTERKQVVTARVSGQVRSWHVVEGSRVKSGDQIVDVDDNDAGLAGRLEEQKRFLYSRLNAAQQELEEQKQAVAAQMEALEATVSAAKANQDSTALAIDVAKQAKKNAEFARTYQLRRYEMNEQLFKDPRGLESQLNRDESLMQSERALTEVNRAEVEIQRARAALEESKARVKTVQANGTSTVALARRDQERAEQNLNSVKQSLQEIETRIERFKARNVKSPCDGIVFRISANSGVGGQMVKEGDELAEIVPDTTDRVVELLIDGVDAPLIAAHMEQTGVGPHVRLQFEGWPGIQFAGWPSVAIGTFGGRVRQIDPTDNGNGKFRILVQPDKLFEGDEWPEGLYQVTLGYELWRQFNGFPPVVAPKAPDKKNNAPSK